LRFASRSIAAIAPSNGGKRLPRGGTLITRCGRPKTPTSQTPAERPGPTLLLNQASIVVTELWHRLLIARLPVFRPGVTPTELIPLPYPLTVHHASRLPAIGFGPFVAAQRDRCRKRTAMPLLCVSEGAALRRPARNTCRAPTPALAPETLGVWRRNPRSSSLISASSKAGVSLAKSSAGLWFSWASVCGIAKAQWFQAAGFQRQRVKSVKSWRPGTARTGGAQTCIEMERFEFASTNHRVAGRPVRGSSPFSITLRPQNPRGAATSLPAPSSTPGQARRIRRPLPFGMKSPWSTATCSSPRRAKRKLAAGSVRWSTTARTPTVVGRHSHRH